MNYKTFYVSRGDEPFEQAERWDLCGFKYYGGEVPCDDPDFLMSEIVRKIENENSDEIDLYEPFNLFTETGELLGKYNVRKEVTIDFYADKI